MIQGLNALQLMNANKRPFSDILSSSINLIIQEDITHLPVIVTVSAMYYDFLQSHFMVRASITTESGKMVLDLKRFNKEDEDMPGNIHL
jgi:hypothetical protein